MRLFFLLVMIVFIPQMVMGDDCVILLHGLARTHRSFNKMEAALSEAGYKTINYDYPSTRYEIEKLARDAIGDAVSQCHEADVIHFVTHSMGGILVRQYLSQEKIPNLGRVVMLGPPNKGSQVVDRLKNFPGFYFMNGPADLQLGTDENSVPNQLGGADFDLGIIAGTSSINLMLSLMLPNPDDGKVSVENTKLEGMKDHISLPVTHPLMMKNKEVIYQVIYFLKHGTFDCSQTGMGGARI